MASARVHVLTTGGTIARKFDESHVARMVGVEGLAASSKIPGVTTEFRSVFEKSSSEMKPDDWLVLARTTEESLRDEADGIVILHGTDTMQYTAAALSFIIRGLSIPVVITGSMVPGSEPASDSRGNFLAALRVAAFADLAEVCVVFSADTQGRRKTIIRGTRAKKVQSTGLNAFASINAPPLGTVTGARISLAMNRMKRGHRTLVARPELDSKVGLVKLSPALSRRQLERSLKGTRGVVLEGMGVGHLRSDLLETIRAYGKSVVISTQCLCGGEKLGTYDHDRTVMELPNVILGRGMLPETALVKLMWVLPQTRGIDETREMMLRDVSGELE